MFCDGIVVARAIFAPKDKNYLRYLDSFTNMADEDRIVKVAWGGATGAFDDGGRVAVATTASGDAQIDLNDSFVTVMQNAKDVKSPMAGPSGHGPSAHVIGTKISGLLTSVGDMYGNPFEDKWPGYDPAHIGYVFTLRLKPGESAALMTFVVKGLSEVYDPRGGFPIKTRDGLVVPNFDDVYAGKQPKIPAAGSEIARVTETARQLSREPDLRGLTPHQSHKLPTGNCRRNTSSLLFQSSKRLFHNSKTRCRADKLPPRISLANILLVQLHTIVTAPHFVPSWL